ncbi:hypothetical protein ABT297_03945 [Dactylosporangium sp. NPDC000555]|uniref:hypothetical protein n=1 Tax=Dactylosporangium sp. NPDC000555 TaxID=3154260 RepID=UPI003319A32E
MHRLTRHIITAGAVSIAASLGTTDPAAAAPTQPACYGQPLERVDVAWPTGKLMASSELTVAVGSPCRDINVQALLDVDGKPACRRLRVRWAATGKTTRWTSACRRWTVIARGATEGAGYVIEAQGRPASVGVRS